MTEDRLRASLDAIDEAFVRMGAVRDASGRVIVDFELLYCNRAATALMRRRGQDLLGHRLLELFPSHITNGLFDAYARVVETGEPLRRELAFDDNGLRGEFEVIASREDDGFVLTARDISERKRHERQEAALREQLQTALTSRIVIEQAKGYVACATGTDPETAFDSIRSYARNNNLRLPDVCRRVLVGDVPELLRGGRGIRTHDDASAP